MRHRLEQGVLHLLRHFIEGRLTHSSLPCRHTHPQAKRASLRTSASSASRAESPSPSATAPPRGRHTCGSTACRTTDPALPAPCPWATPSPLAVRSFCHSPRY